MEHSALEQGIHVRTQLLTAEVLSFCFFKDFTHTTDYGGYNNEHACIQIQTSPDGENRPTTPFSF